MPARLPFMLPSTFKQVVMPWRSYKRCEFDPCNWEPFGTLAAKNIPQLARGLIMCFNAFFCYCHQGHCIAGPACSSVVLSPFSFLSPCPGVNIVVLLLVLLLSVQPVTRAGPAGRHAPVSPALLHSTLSHPCGPVAAVGRERKSALESKRLTTFVALAILFS